ncbi:MAG: hypothetical protein QG670_1284 [Thermoproteota archaeon]|nr:hypothetical protein [Thermoproteota archaeon]
MLLSKELISIYNVEFTNSKSIPALCSYESREKIGFGVI